MSIQVEDFAGFYRCARVSRTLIPPVARPWVRHCLADLRPSRHSRGAGTYPQDLAVFSCDSVLVAVRDTISGHTVSSLGNPVMNDYGVIAFLASFTDGSQAIVEATKRWR